MLRARCTGSSWLNASSGPPSTGSVSMRSTSVARDGTDGSAPTKSHIAISPPIDTAAAKTSREMTQPTPRRTATGDLQANG